MKEGSSSPAVTFFKWGVHAECKHARHLLGAKPSSTLVTIRIHYNLCAIIWCLVPLIRRGYYIFIVSGKKRWSHTINGRRERYVGVPQCRIRLPSGSKTRTGMLPRLNTKTSSFEFTATEVASCKKMPCGTYENVTGRGGTKLLWESKVHWVQRVETKHWHLKSLCWHCRPNTLCTLKCIGTGSHPHVDDEEMRGFLATLMFFIQQKVLSSFFFNIDFKKRNKSMHTNTTQHA